MIRGIYTAANAMSLSMQKMNVFAHNVSNAQTTGYKKKTYSVHAFPDVMLQVAGNNAKAPMAQGSYMDDAGVNQKQGTLRQTGNALDVAIDGEKYYFQTANHIPGTALQPGETEADRHFDITRDGHFRLNNKNYLVDADGHYVLNTNGQAIQLPAAGLPQNAQNNNTNQQLGLEANKIRIDQYGDIYNSSQPNGAPLARLRVVEFTDAPTNNGEAQDTFAMLKKYGLDMPRDYRLLEAVKPDGVVEGQAGQKGEAPFKIRQGYVENSNINIVTEMVNMMMTSKDYDMSQKIIGTQDKVLDKSINEMGRLQ